MKPWKSTIANGVRRTLPLNSRQRLFAAAAYYSVKDAGVFARHARANFVRAASASRTTELDYRAWRALNPHDAETAISGSTNETTFGVVVEIGALSTPAEIKRTTESVENQLGCVGRVVQLQSGSPLQNGVASLSEDFVLLLRAGSVLSPYALADVAKQHRIDPALELIVFDSDVHGATGPKDPLFRPAWSPDMLLGFNYIDRAFAIKRSSMRSSESARLTDRGVWDLLLSGRFSERNAGNIANVLLTEAHSTVRSVNESDAEMVKDVLARHGETVETTVDRDVVRVRFQPAEWPTVSIVIPTRHSRVNLGRLLPSLATTDYPRFDVKIIDNGGESQENTDWYVANSQGLDLTVKWWTETPFNYSRVNNVAARATDGDIIVMLNDDTEIVDALWLKEMVGLLMREGVGVVGVQHRQADDLIQHGGVMIGPGGFADNLFAGMTPGSDTLIGPTTWYRNSLAVTGACLAIRRTDFEEVNGLDEAFVLCGSDVVLGLDQIIRGRRNVVIPFDTVRHFESLTRGTAVPAEDFYASYWRYHPWLQGGDPYVSKNVSRLSAVPRFKDPRDENPVKLALEMLGRSFIKHAQSSSISEEASALIGTASISAEEVAAVHQLHAEFSGPLDIRVINWFIPDIDMPFFGGLNTAFRLAAKLAREHGVLNRFVVLAAPNRAFVASALTAAFPELAAAEIAFYDGSDEQIALIPPADAAVATLWLTAIHVAKSQGVKRKFYLMQDYEPSFYPASTLFAMAEESYRLGLYGLCNTVSMHSIYTEMYQGSATYFTPAVDQSIYHAEGRREKLATEPVTIFAYARDHFRNCWELVYTALTEIKRIHGDGVRIVAAGARYLPASADFIDMGLLDYRATGRLYREMDIGLTMQISRHPSYLPLELMSSGVAMVAPASNWFTWLFDDEENSLLTMRTLDDIVAKLDRLVRDAELRHEISARAISTIAESHADWDVALGGIHAYMSDPENAEAKTSDS
ncbi:rhamnosyltransferase WsaF family glycosyltransferase [Cryobacterium zhongshanensis]|uniref:Glycosyltransferase n=1 Tax=Cryobacterium zhongshanensis TaxID=2928153 RepID=A0AA41QX67_9MICO|nr:glycosyltransferase [Cryobacterium zhongshanensis]MCI4658399.1 glycosyltransferase [Cryobacterium zhongshanensis]